MSMAIEQVWWNEANRVDFEAEGLSCAMRRGPLGTWCGYVGVPRSHPWWGKSYRDVVKPEPHMLRDRVADDHGAMDLFIAMLSDHSPEEGMSISLCVRVHGGLTYAADHEPYGKPDGLWWFGFDCAHCNDFVPGLRNVSAEYERVVQSTQTYRTQEYVVSECQSLAVQLQAIGKSS